MDQYFGVDIVSSSTEEIPPNIVPSSSSASASASSPSSNSILFSTSHSISSSDTISNDNDGNNNNLINCVRYSVIGDDNCIPTPLGPRKLTYCDNTASGRGNRMIEEPLMNEVIPYYSNTHTHTSITGIQSHNYLEEARALVRDGVHAHEKDDAVLFTYKGSTHASNMVKHFLLRKNTSNSSNTPTATTQRQSPCTCTFPGCNRFFESSADLLTHARTHPDGESTAYRTTTTTTTTTTSSPATASSSSSPTSSINDILSPTSSPALSSVHTVVLVGPYAHHSSFLPYLESGIILHHIKENKLIGGMDYEDFLSRLIQYRQSSLCSAESPPRLIGLFTIASNITGTLCDIYTITAIMHAFQGIAVWDGAAAVPHVPLYMNPPRNLSWITIQQEIIHNSLSYPCASNPTVIDNPSTTLVSVLNSAASILSSLNPQETLSVQEYSCSLDALYFSMHKFVGGGIGTPGILVIKRHLIQSYTPYTPGGGTVFYVSKDGVPQYLGNDTDREEGGSPDVIGSVRAGLCWHLVHSIGWSTIMVREYTMYKLAHERLSSVPNITIFGTRTPSQISPIFRSTIASLGKYSPMSIIPSNVPILSFLIHHPQNTSNLYHWGYICSLLNDIFGIQTRGGCLCAGIYSQDLLGVTENESENLRDHLLNKEELLRPGFIRISFVYHLSYAEFQYILEALVWIAKNAEYLLPYYTPFSDTGEWRIIRSKISNLLEKERISKKNYSSSKGKDVPDRSQQYWNYRLTYNEAYEYIQTSYSGNGAGHIDAAQKGTHKNHPTRRWLQDIKYRVNDTVNDNTNNIPDTNSTYGLGYQHPNHTIKLNLRRRYNLQENDDDNPSTTTDRTASNDQLLLKLFACYLIEADTLIKSIRSQSSLHGLSKHDPSALLSPTGQTLRWYLLGCDIDDTVLVDSTDDTPAKNTTTRIIPTVPWPLGQRLYTYYHSYDLCRKETNINTADYIDAEFAVTLDRILRTTKHELTVMDEIRWNGNDIVVTSTAININSSVPSDSILFTNYRSGTTDESVQSKIVDKTVKDRLKNRKIQHANNLILSTTTAVKTDSSIPTSTIGSLLAPPLTSTVDFSIPAVIMEDLMDRKRTLASSQAALESLHIDRVPKETARALHQGLRQAILDFGMIRHGDRIMVGLSGGKDSMTLLIQLLRLQMIAPVSFSIAAATVDPQYEGYDPTPLKEWCQSIGVPHFFEAAPIMDIAPEKMGNDSICSFCSRIKRGLLYTACRREGYNVLALGQHADDCAESFVMSAFRNGRLRTMKAHYLTDEGDIRIIRPLVNVRERHTRNFAHHIRLPIIPENCPACFSGPTVRYKIKRLLAAEEATNPSLFPCLLQAIYPLMLSEGEAAMRDIGKHTPMVPVIPTKEPPHFANTVDPGMGTKQKLSLDAKTEEQTVLSEKETPLFSLFGNENNDDF